VRAFGQAFRDDFRHPPGTGAEAWERPQGAHSNRQVTRCRRLECIRPDNSFADLVTLYNGRLPCVTLPWSRDSGTL